LVLGGVDIPYEYGLLGHSDADVLLHAVSDAVLGALGLGDIGRYFPDTDPTYKGVNSLLLLEHVIGLAQTRGFRVSNLDTTIVAQKPKLAPYVSQMVTNLAKACQVPSGCVNVKATTTEELGFTGRGEGISAHAVVLMTTDEI
jgi:2-C-methyl-D-erythritol 2,4-cyclodiphosphate synthase